MVSAADLLSEDLLGFDSSLAYVKEAKYCHYLRSQYAKETACGKRAADVIYASTYLSRADCPDCKKKMKT